MEELAKWYSRTVEMLTEADPRGEEPVFKWRRNAKVSVDTERQVQPLCWSGALMFMAGYVADI